MGPQILALSRIRWNLLGLLPAAIALLWYAGRVAPCVTGDDPAEMQAMTWAFGLPHGPSYPLYIALARFFAFLPLGDFARRVNLFSAVAASAALWTAWALVGALSSCGKTGAAAPLPPSRNRFAWVIGAIATVGLLAWSHTFVAISIISEMYTLQVLLSLAVVLLLVLWAGHKRRWMLLAAFGLLGLSLGNHNTSLALFPGALVFVAVELWRDRAQLKAVAGPIGAGMTGAVVGQLIPFYLLWRNHVPFSHWEWIRSCPLFFGVPVQDSFWRAWWYELSNQQFRHEVLRAPPGLVLDQLNALPHRFAGELFPAGAAIAVLGWVLLWRSWRVNTLLSLLVAAHCYVAISLHLTNKTHIYVIVPVAIAAVYAGHAVATLAGWLDEGARRLLRAKGAGIVSPAIALALVGTGGTLNAGSGAAYRSWLLEHAPAFACDAVLPMLGSRPDEHRETAFRKRIHALVEKLPDDAIVFSNWYEHYAIEYVNHVERGVKGMSVFETFPYGRGVKEFPVDYLNMIRDPKRTRRVFFVIDARPPAIDGYRLMDISPESKELVRD